MFLRVSSRQLTITTSSTVRRAIDIGAQRENREHFHSSLLEDQLRKRAFWTLYSFDREWRHP